jgi:exosortase D (VPLPA-CTERM-specific)
VTEDSSAKKSKGMLWLGLAVLLGAFCLQYIPVFGNLVKRWRGDFEFSIMVPFIFLYLTYTNRESLREVELRSSWVGLLVLSFSGVLYLAGQVGSTETLTYVSLWACLVGLCWLILGMPITKALAFPFLILSFIVPLPYFLNNLFTFKLKLISSSLSVEMMRMIGISAYREGNIIDLGLTQLQVVDACSGLRYVYPLALMSLLFGYFFHKKFWERLVILLAAVPISVFSNALRIAITGYLSSKVSPETADSFFHGFSGWLIFMVSLVFLVSLSWLIRTVKSGSEVDGETPGQRDRPPRSSFDLSGVKPSYLYAASILFILFWAFNTALSSAQIVPHRKAFQDFPLSMGSWVGEKTTLRKDILNFLWADDYMLGTFTHRTTGDVILLFVPYYEYQGTRHTAHAPVACLIGGGFAPRERRMIERDFAHPFGLVKIRQMLMEKNEDLLLSNYWFQQRGRVISSEYSNKWYLFWDSFAKQRTDGALVRIEMPLRKGQDVQEAQAVIDAFTRELLRILPDYVPN